MTTCRRLSCKGAILLGLVAAPTATSAVAQTYLVQHLAGAGGGGGATGGFRTTARLGAPTAVATDGKGNLWVADAGNCAILKVAANGNVTVVAGTPGVCGSEDGAPGLARFAAPRGVAVDTSGTVYVADTGNHAIRKVTAAGLTTTLAGTAGVRGIADGTGAAARFDAPTGITRDAAGNLYVADRDNHAIRKVTLAGVVTTFAGSTGHRGSSDGTGTAARFAAPEAVAADASGLVVADTGNHTVRQVTTAGVVTTLAGAAGQAGHADGQGTAARFGWPGGIALVGTLVFVGDTDNEVIRTVTRTGVVDTVAGMAGESGSDDGQGAAARFSAPRGLAADAAGAVYIADAGNRSVRLLSASGIVTTVAGLGPCRGATDGPASHAAFDRPTGLALPDGAALVVADGGNHTLRKVVTGGNVTTLAGLAQQAGSADGRGSSARFADPAGLARDASGNTIVADSSNHVIRRVTLAGDVTTIAGRAGEAGSADGQGTTARFNYPTGVAVDKNGNILVADSGNHTIRRISTSGVVTTVAGTAGLAGRTNGTGAAARFANPSGVAVDAAGNVFVADRSNSVIRRITAQGAVSVWAGTAGDQGSRDGTGAAARFRFPIALALDASDNLWVGDGSVVRRISSSRIVTTVLGSALHAGSEDGLGTAARFTSVLGLVVDATGIVYIADGGNDCLRRAVPTTRPSPVITGVSPSSVMARGGSEVVITGQNFPTSGLAVRFGGVLATGVRVLSPTTLVATVPASAVGARSVSVTTDEGSAFMASGITYAKDAYLRYLAEGATCTFFDTRISLLNPGTVAATATLSFLSTAGTSTTHAVTVPARTRTTVWPAKISGLAKAEFSTRIDADQPLVVDRTVSWSLSDAYGAHAEAAVISPALTWYLAEGATHSGLDLFYLLQNPNATPAEVRVRFLRPSGAPLEKTYTLAATSRTNIWVDVEEFPGLGQALANTDVSAVIEVLNDQPIIVERALYSGVPGQFFGAGHESAGVTAPALEWFLAEGATGSYFDLFVLVANPSDSEAQVEASFLLPNGSTVDKAYTVAANSRFNIWVNLEDPRLADTAVSTTIRSVNGVPVIVERAMWWPAGGWYEAHNTPGATLTGTRWGLAEGEVDAARGMDTYILIANTSASIARVKVTVLFENGASADRTFEDLPPHSRFNVPIGHYFPQAAGKRFGAIVESLGTPAAQIVVERAVYWNAAGQNWAAGTNALATRLQ